MESADFVIRQEDDEISYLFLLDVTRTTKEHFGILEQIRKEKGLTQAIRHDFLVCLERFFYRGIYRPFLHVYSLYRNLNYNLIDAIQLNSYFPKSRREIRKMLETKIN